MSLSNPLTTALNPGQGMDDYRTSRGMDMDKLRESGLPISTSITQADKKLRTGAEKMSDRNRAMALAHTDDLMVTKPGFSRDAATERDRALIHGENALRSASAGVQSDFMAANEEAQLKNAMDAAQHKEFLDYANILTGRKSARDALSNALMGDQIRLYAQDQANQLALAQAMFGLQNSLMGGLGNIMGGLSGGLGGLGGLGGMTGGSWDLLQGAANPGWPLLQLGPGS